MKKLFLIVVLTVAVFSSGTGQVPFMQHYYLLRKNEPVQVNTIFQDKTGFVWFGTSKGLFRFDGVNYLRFTQAADSLASDHITALAQDSMGRIWIGYEDGKIDFLEKGSVKKFETAEGNSTEAISKILFDRNGNLWFATLNDGLYFYAKNRLHRLDEAEGMPDLYVYDIAEDSLGNIWAGTDGGIAVCALNENKISIRVINHKNGLQDNIIKKLIPQSSAMLLATEDAGMLRYDMKTGNVEPIVVDWKFGSISDVVIKHDQLWIASQQGILVQDLSQHSMKQYPYKAFAGIGPISTLLKDEEGNIWMGSRSGVTRTSADGLEFIDDLSGANDQNILAVTTDQKGRIWFSNGEGLFTYEVDKTGIATVINRMNNSSYKKFTVISLYCDDQGYIWAGLYGEGVLRINAVTGEVKHLDKELRNGNVLSITGKNNVIWLATLGGASKIDITDGRPSVTNYSSADGLSSDFIYQVFIDSKDRVWFATDGKGVSMLDKSGFHHYEQGLSSRVVYGISEDVNHNIWVHAQGSGLYTFQENRFNAVGEDFTIRDNNIHAIAADKAGNIVVMHDMGMDILDIKGKFVRSLSEEAGLRNKVVTLNGSSKDAEGNLFFASSGGIIKFSGSDQKNAMPIARVTDVKVFDQSLDISKAVELSHDENNLTIRYRGLWYQDPQGVYFQYRLENYDVNWIATREQSVTYSKLPPGKYTFRLQVSNSEKFGKASETTINFIIEPPFWRTIPFYMLSLALVVVLGFAFIKYRERKLRYDKFILEGRVRRRTFEIQRQKEEIQAQNEEIMAQAEEINGINENLEMIVRERTAELERKNQALEEYAFINAHKLRSPLASILGLVHLLLKTELTEEGKEIGRHLRQSADELDDVVHSITKTIEKADKDYPIK